MLAISPLPPSLPCPPDARGVGGLVALAGRREQPLPLREVRVRTHIVGAVARTVVEQTYANPLSQPMEAVHIFPLPEEGAVTEVELCCGELTVRAECRERREAEARFAQARQDGHRAALLTQERPDVHTLRVTNLPPGQAVRVRIVVEEQLESEDGLLRYRFPTTIAPRYMPGKATGSSGAGVAEDTDRSPDASRLSPPLRIEGGTKLDLEVSFEGMPCRVASSLHALRMELDGGLRVAPNGSHTCDRDFVLAFCWAPATQTTTARAWTDGEHAVLVVEPPLVAAQAIPRDAVFCLDISGSMSGVKLRSAKQALRTALRGLAPGDRFRILAFDDRLDPYNPDFVPFGDATLADAERWIGRLDSRGGTDMKPPLQAAFEGARPEGRLRTVLFITDGEVGNDVELVSLIAARRGNARLFTLGIDTAVNGNLLKQFARVGGGACTLCTPSDDIEAVVARIEARFGSPLVDELRVTSAGGPGAGTPFEEARPEGLTLFAGKPACLFVRGAGPFVVTGRSATGPVSWEVAPEAAGASLRPLWARARVACLEDRLTTRPFEEEAIRPEVLRIALAAGIASRFTAFVAVEVTTKVTGERVEVVQPAELPHAWEVPDTVMACAAPMPSGAVSAASMARASSPAVQRAASAPMMVVRELSAAFDALRSHRMSPPPPPAPPSPAEDPDFDDANFEDADFDGASQPVLRRRATAGRAPGRLAPQPLAPNDLAARLVQTQSADGSWGGDVARTAAAILTLVRLGHTRTSGLRKRAVAKAALWLQGRTEALAVAALAALHAVERGEPLPADAAFSGLANAGAEGQAWSTVGGG